MAGIVKKKDILSFNLSSNKKEDSCPYYCPVDGSQCKVSKVVNSHKETEETFTVDLDARDHEGFASFYVPEETNEEKSLLNRILFCDFKIDAYILMKGLIFLFLAIIAILGSSNPFVCGVLLVVIGILVVKF